MSNSQNILEAEVVPRRVVALAGAGGRMADFMLPRFAEWQAPSDRRFDIDLIDANPTKLMKATRDARALGLSAKPVEARIQDVMVNNAGDHEVFVVAIDDVAAIETTLLTSIERKCRIMVTIFFEIPGQRLMGFVIVLGRDDDDRKREMARLFGALKAFAINASGRVMFSVPANRAIETVMRGFMVEHVTEAIDNILADLPARSDVLVTRDGRNAMRLVVEESDDGFKTPDALAKSVMSKVTTPLQRGSDFMIAEIAPAGVRFHTARLRAVDGQITINGAEVIDTTPTVKGQVVKTLGSIRDAAFARAADLTERNTVTITHPIKYSD